MKNESNSKSMRYLVDIQFYLIKSTSCLLSITKSLVCYNQLWLGGYFYESRKMQLHQVNENQNSFVINLTAWHHPVRSRWVCVKLEVNSGACLFFRGHGEYAWGQKFGYDIRGQDVIEGHTSPELTSDLMHTQRDLSGWHHTLKLIKAVLFDSLPGEGTHIAKGYGDVP